MLRPVNRRRMLGAAAAVWILIVAVGGCGKKPVGPDDGDIDHGPVPPKYLAPISPQNTLQNLISAYTRRDSVETGVIYDSNYQGTSTDPSAPTPVSTFTKADEIRHVGRLKLDANIVSVFVDLGSPTTWQVLDGNASDPPGWKVIQVTSQTVRIEDISTFHTWEARNNVIEYTFKPDSIPGAPAAEDTVWSVVRWTEIAN